MPEPITGPDVLDHLSKRAEENGDNFRLKVLRRPNASSQQTTWIASFSDATWSMIANAESWLSPFAGGGLYVLHVFDGKTSRQLGVILPSEIAGAPRQPDPRVTKTSSWLGPNLIDVPSVGPATNGAVATGPHTLAGEPHPTAQPRSAQEAGFVGLFDESKKLDQVYRQREAELAERERKMAEDRARSEMEAIRRSGEEARRIAEERARALEAKIDRMVEIAAKPAVVPPPGPSVTEILTGLLSAIGPLVTVWLTTSAQDRKERIDAERARSEREAKILEEAGKRPVIDPTLLDILTRQAAQAEGSAKQFSDIMRAQAESSRVTLESQATTQRSMLQMIADVAQLQTGVGGRDEEKSVDWGKVAQGVLQGLAAMQQAQRGPGAPGAPGVAQPQLAGAVPGTTPAPAPEIPVNPSEAFNEIEKMVKSKQPPSEVITKLKAALDDEAAKKEIAACGGLIEVFNERLGEWSQNDANAPYLEALQKELVTSGIFPASTFE